MKTDTRYLTGIRGFAALIVIFGHASNAGMHIIPGLDLHSTAKAGVWLFFVLSAYLLTDKLWRAIERDGVRTALRTYAFMRTARIMPLYLVFISALFLFGIFSSEGAWRHALLLQGDMHLWTIPVEMAFYLVLPVILLLMKSRRSVLIILGVSVLAYFAYGPSLIESNTISLPNYMIFFAAGMALSLIPPVKLPSNWATAAIVFALICILVLSPRFLMWAFNMSQSDALSLSLLFAFPWVVVIHAAESSRLFRAIFSSPPLQFAGRISFGLYLVHYPIFELVKNEPYQDLAADPLLVVGVAVAIAACAYYLIEEPILRWARGSDKAPAPSHKLTDSPL